MAEKGQERAMLRPAEYAALVELYGIDVIPNWHRSLITTSGGHRIESTGGVIEEVYRPSTGQGIRPAIISNSHSSTMV